MLSTAPYEVPQYLLDRARGLPRVPMAIAGADNMVVMESARQATDAGLITPVLVGDRDEIESLAETMAWDISG
ncbi:MAG: phosphate acetyltransferase, partial [Alphaproteobacteria bacterium]